MVKAKVVDWDIDYKARDHKPLFVIPAFYTPIESFCVKIDHRGKRDFKDDEIIYSSDEVDDLKHNSRFKLKIK